MRKKRIAGYDNQKFFLIFLVILGHFVEAHFDSQVPYRDFLYMWMYFFHMPAFVFLAGLCQKKTDTLNGKRVLSFVLIGFISKLFVMITVGAFTGEYPFRLVRESGMPWFMFAMAAFIVMTYVLRNVKPAFALCFAVAMGLAIGYDDTFNKGLLTLNRVISFFPFYLLGYYLEPEKVMYVCKKTAVRIFSVLFVAAYTWTLFQQRDYILKLRHIVIGSASYNEMALENGGFLLRVMCYVIAVLAIIALISLIPNKKIPVITTMGERTLAIYFWHRNVIRILTYTGASAFLISKAGGSVWISIPISILITFMLGWKGFMIPMNYLMKGIYKEKSNE